MTNKQLEEWGFTQEGWWLFIHKLAEEFGEGKLISHEWLYKQFGLEKLEVRDFKSTEEFVQALQLQQFAYMSVVDAVRWDLLEQEKMFLKNVRGEGYVIMRPEDQTQYAYDSFIEDIKKAIKVAGLIMNNVLPVDLTQQAKDNDLRAKFGTMKQLLSSIKK